MGDGPASNNVNGDVAFLYGDLYYTPRATFEQFVKDITLMRSDCRRTGFAFP